MGQYLQQVWGALNQKQGQLLGRLRHTPVGRLAITGSHMSELLHLHRWPVQRQQTGRMPGRDLNIIMKLK